MAKSNEEHTMFDKTLQGKRGIETPSQEKQIVVKTTIEIKSLIYFIILNIY